MDARNPVGLMLRDVLFFAAIGLVACTTAEYHVDVRTSATTCCEVCNDPEAPLIGENQAFLFLCNLPVNGVPGCNRLEDCAPNLGVDRSVGNQYITSRSSSLTGGGTARNTNKHGYTRTTGVSTNGELSGHSRQTCADDPAFTFFAPPLGIDLNCISAVNLLTSAGAQCDDPRIDTIGVTQAQQIEFIQNCPVSCACPICPQVAPPVGDACPVECGVCAVPTDPPTGAPTLPPTPPPTDAPTVAKIVTDAPTVAPPLTDAPTDAPVMVPMDSMAPTTDKKDDDLT